MAEQKEVLEATKAERLHRAYIHSSFIKESLEETDSPAWRLALQKKSAREQRRAAFLQQLMKKREEAEGQDGSKSMIANNNVSLRKSVGYGLRLLTTALGAASDKKKYSTSNLAGSSMNERELYHANLLDMESASTVIKQQRQQREKRKENLSRRRKRFVQECVYSHSRIGTARVASILEDVVLRDTNSEKDVQGEMNRILTYKDVARENRSMRNQEYVNQQELDSISAIDRDTCRYHNLLLQFEDNSEMQMIQRKNVQVSIEAADHFLSEQISSAIMNEMVSFVLFIAGKREETLNSRDPTVFLSSETWDEYKVKFTNGYMLGSNSPMYRESGHSELLDNHELQQYLSSFRPFHAPEQQQPFKVINDGSLFLGATEAIEDCFVLGEEIKSLRWIARLASIYDSAVKDDKLNGLNRSSSTSASDVPTTTSRRLLRVLIFGPPFAGKETQAKLLGETHNLVVLSVHELVQNAVHNSNELGQQVRGLLASGKELPPDLYGCLLINSIRDIEAQELASESNSKAGWLIYDLPATEQHGKHLEKQLTGYIDPALAPSPYDFESAIAPGRVRPGLSPTFLHGKSGVDLVFHIDCPLATVLDRCLGRVEDCATGDKYHLVLDPPSEDSIVRYRLHHVNPSAYSSELLSLHCLANDEFSADHKAWHGKFKTLHEPSSLGLTINEIHETIAAVVNQLQKEQQDQAESKQLQQEAGEQELMTNEETRQRRVDAFELEIDEAKVGVAKIEAAVVEAEEAKAKKEEILELRQTLEVAQRQLDTAEASANEWMDEEKSHRPEPSSKYSGEMLPAKAQALAALWNDMEAEYISLMKTTFALLREQRHRVTERAQVMTSEFCEFVRRPDQKQEIVTLFQKQFNEVVEEMRFDDLSKIELHARVDMLQDELASLIETKVAENDEELSSVVGDGWTEDACQQVAAIYQMALQAECDRFRVSVQLLVDGYSAASSDQSQMSSIMEAWQVHQSRLEIACKIYRDSASETPVEAPSAPTAAAAGKAAPKGKAKPSVAAVVPPTSAVPTSDDALSEALSMSELLAEYAQVLQRCGSWLESIVPIANAVAEKVVNGDEFANQQVEGDLCKINLLNGIRYEHDLMQRRCGEGLISVCVVQPEFIERFPATTQLREDTIVRVDADRRLLPRTPPDAPPTIEETHELLLNPRQRESLRAALVSQTVDDSGLLPLITVVETMAAFTSQPDALPDVWRCCPAHVIAEIAASFTMKQSAFVDIEALLSAMSTRDDLLRQFQEDEAREELARQCRLELKRQQEEQERELLLQQQQEDQDDELTAADATE
ncbi:unnamed protein product [Phytophthora lilii]|uniref:Unnamed protein product n=1 Tax=Phytophthora lilii TaxID=2077276 RepID=A0A9W6WUJ4_9STRA|nr:unnamed protein product [Phytophthora lilii]